MTIMLANAAKAKLIEQERSYLNGLLMRLYTVDYVPTASMTLANFQPAPADSGLSPDKPIAFTPAVLNGANQGELNAAALTWTAAYNAGNITVFGYYVWDSVNNWVVYAERAPTPFPVTAPGQTYTVTPRKQMDTM